MVRTVILVLIVMLGSACGLTGPDDQPPQLISVQVLEGQATCRGCAVSGSGRDVTPGPDNVLTIQPNTIYTFRAVVRTSFNRDRCVYNVFHVGWDAPDRTWDCIPETNRDITIDRVTGRTGAPITDSDKITLSLNEWTISNRQQLSTAEIRVYTVQLASPDGDGSGRLP